MICNNCGKENIDTAVFCESCGTKLTPAAPAPEVDTTVQETNAPVQTAPQSQPQYTPPQPQYTPPQPQYTPPQPQYVPPQPRYTPPQPRPVQAVPYTPVVKPASPVIPPEYKPLRGWAYFGWQLLFAIPVVGLVLLIVFACGGTPNINLRNFARSYFCAMLVGVILVVLGIILALIFGASLAVLFEDMMSMY